MLYDSNQACSYLFDLNDESVIDASRMGSKSKFLNHSNTPNCVVKVVVVNGDHRIQFSAKKDICAGDELTFDYGYSNDVAPPWAKQRQAVAASKGGEHQLGRFSVQPPSTAEELEVVLATKRRLGAPEDPQKVRKAVLGLRQRRNIAARQMS